MRIPGTGQRMATLRKVFVLPIFLLAIVPGGLVPAQSDRPPFTMKISTRAMR